MEQHSEPTELLQPTSEGHGEGKGDAAPQDGAPESAQQPDAAWPEADERGLTMLGGVRFDRGAVQLLQTEYTPQEIEDGLRESNPRAWARRLNYEHLERHGIGRLQVAGTPDTPVISGHRFAGFERRGRGGR